MFDLNKSIIIIITDHQYRIENMSMTFRLIVIPSSIQPRLNTEEYLIISVIIFLFICMTLPTHAVRTMNKKIKGFH